MHNPYVRYYLDQQQGHGMPVFRGSAWQQGYGLGGLFRSVARAVMPMVKSGAKALGKIALNAGANLLGDVASGKNLKEAVKTRGKEAVNVAKNRAVKCLQTYAQTGSGRKSTVKKRSGRSKIRKRSRKTTARSRKTTKRSRSKKRIVKKRKASRSVIRSSQAKRRRTAPDIFG